MSRVTCHMSHVTCHIFFIFLPSPLPKQNIGLMIRIGQEIQCLQYARFFKFLFVSLRRCESFVIYLGGITCRYDCEPTLNKSTSHSGEANYGLYMKCVLVRWTAMENVKFYSFGSSNSLFRKLLVLNLFCVIHNQSSLSQIRTSTYLITERSKLLSLIS